MKLIRKIICLCAATEFLEKGDTNASLRCIAEKAKTSTNAIYVCFHDKEGLFPSIVETITQEFLDRSTERGRAVLK